MEHQRRLAGAVGAEHRDALAVGDGQVEAVERRRRPLGYAKRSPRAWIAQLMRPPASASRHARASAGEEARVGAGAARARASRGMVAGVAAREHREVDALAALVGAQEQRGRRRGRSPAPASSVARRGSRARRARRACAATSSAIDEQVAVHEGRDQRRAARRPAGARAPCSTSGKLVVAPSSTALSVPISAFADGRAERREPCLGHGQRPERRLRRRRGRTARRRRRTARAAGRPARGARSARAADPRGDARPRRARARRRRRPATPQRRSRPRRA